MSNVGVEYIQPVRSGGRGRRGECGKPQFDIRIVDLGRFQVSGGFF